MIVYSFPSISDSELVGEMSAHGSCEDIQLVRIVAGSTENMRSYPGYAAGTMLARIHTV
jgi:hypothetical protein